MASDRYLAPYRRALARAGPGFEALLWADRASQRARFETLASMIDLSGRRLLDLGCGRGDLLAFLGEREIRPAAYTGVDALEGMAREAEKACAAAPGVDARIIRGDFIADEGLIASLVGPADVVFFGGSLNTMAWPLARSCLDRAWGALRAGKLAFNFLSDRAGGPPTGPGKGPAFRFDPVEALAWALGVSGRVAFRQDYLPQHDATIVLARG